MKPICNVVIKGAHGIHIMAIAALWCGLLLVPNSARAQTNRPIDVPLSYHLNTMAIPSQVLLSQRAGLGRVISGTWRGAELEVLHDWWGGDGSNRVTIVCNDVLLNPFQTNQLGLFFATTNQWWRSSDNTLFDGNLFSWSTSTNRSSSEIATTNWTAVNDEYWFVPIPDSTSPLASQTPNLIHAACQEKSEARFNTLLKEAATYPYDSDMSKHARTYVFFNRRFLPTNFVSEVLARRP